MSNCCDSSSFEDFKLGESHENMIIKKLKKENKKLSEENIELLKQLSSTKRQFEAAIQSSQACESIKQRNAELEQELIDIKTAKTDIENRLNITLKTLAELEKKQTCKPKEVQIQNVPPPVENTEKINSLKERISALEEELQNERHQKYIMQTDSSQIYSVASKCFAVEIKTSQSLIEHLLQTKQNNDKLEELQKCFTKLTTKNKKLRSNLIEIDQISQKQIKQANAESEKANKTLEQMRDQNQLLLQNLEQFKNTVSQLEREKQDLAVKLEEQSNEARRLIKEAEDKAAPEISNLTEKLRSQMDKSEQNSLRAKELELKVNCLTKELNCKEEECKNKIQKALKWKERCHKAEQELRDQQNRPHEIQQEQMQQKQILETQKNKEIQDIRDENADLQQKLKKAEKSYQKLQERCEEAEKDLQVSAQRLKDMKKQHKEILSQNEIPQSTWAHCPIPAPLVNYVNEISSNPNTLISNKVTQIVASLLEYQKNEIEKYKAETENAIREKEKLQKKICIITAFISRMFPDVHINYDSLADQEKEREFLMFSINTWRANFEKIKQELNEIHQSVDVHFGILGVDTFADAKVAITDLLFNSKRLKKENKFLYKKLRQANEEVQAISLSLKKQQNRYSQLESTVEELSSENDNLKQQIDELSNLPPDPRLVSENNKLRKKLAEFDEITSQVSEKLQESEESLRDANKEIESKKEEIARLTKQVKNAKKGTNEVQEQLIEKITELKEVIKDQKKQLRKERENYKEQIERFHKESDQVIQQLRNRITDLENDNDKLNTKNVELLASLKTAETKFAALLDEKEREKKQLESQLNAKLMSLNSDLKVQAEEAHMNVDLELKHVIQTLIHTFPFLYDGANDLNIELYEKYLGVLKDKFDDYTKKEIVIRSLLGISTKQSIENAITELKNAVEKTEI